jgi:predicted acetyltransferase
MSEKSWDIFTPEEGSDLDDFAELLTRSLWLPPLAQDNWVQREGLDKIRVAKREGRVAGGLSWHPMPQYFGGKPLTMGGVRLVATAPEARGQGVAHALLKASLVEMYEKGIVLSALFPATQRVYQKAGFYSAGETNLYKLSIGEILPIPPTQARIRLATEADRPTIEALYKQYAALHNGHLTRTPWLWDRCLLMPQTQKPRTLYLIEGKQGAEGYVICHQERIPKQFRGLLEIRDKVLLTPDAFAAFWHFIADHRSHIEEVRWFGGRAEACLAYLPHHQWEIEAALTWMLRIVDLPKALQGRGYPQGIDAEIRLQVEDPLLPWNQGCWRLRVSDGRAEVAPAIPNEETLQIKIEGMAPLFSGFFPPDTLHLLGLLQGAEAPRRTLATLFSSPAPWMPDMF